MSENSPEGRRRKPRHRVVALTPEVRHFAADGLDVEIRKAGKTDEIVITGTPIVYDRDYTVIDHVGEFTERMAPGVATGVLARGADVRFLFNHDGLPLARSTSGTLSLSDTTGGLMFTARLDARQQLANDLSIAIERGDVSQMSCGFRVADDEWDEDENGEHRTILQFDDLLDVSAVTYPASPTTSIEVARRMMLERPVESRARLRRFVVGAREGYRLTGGDLEQLRSFVTVAHDLDATEDRDLENVPSRVPPADAGTTAATGKANKKAKKAKNEELKPPPASPLNRDDDSVRSFRSVRIEAARRAVS